LSLKIQINSKKPGFGKEKSVEDVVTPLGPTIYRPTLALMNRCECAELSPRVGAPFTKKRVLE
jgi:hypothetical protein